MNHIETPSENNPAAKGGRSLPARYAILIAGVLIMAFGIAFCIKGDLGTTPISSLPYVTSLISNLSVGTTTILLHVTLILLQILILRRNYDPIQLLQLPVALIFGWTCDLALFFLKNATPTGYLSKWLFCLTGIVLVAVGVACEVVADVVMLAGEGFVAAVSRAGHFQFSYVKIAFDVFLVVLSAVLSLIFLGHIRGIREGTVAAAFLVGALSKPLIRKLS